MNLARDLKNLLGELTRGRHDQGFSCAIGEQVNVDGQQEGEGLARSGLGDADDVFAIQSQGQAHRLNGRRSFEAHRLNAIQNFGSERKVSESRS